VWSTRVAFFDHPPHLALNLTELRVERRSPGIEHDVPLWGDFSAVQAENFAEAAFDAIADDGLPDRPWHGESKTRSQFDRRAFARPAKGGE
jgi:hypothetical protein